MRVALEREAGGRLWCLALPIGRLEIVAAHEPRLLALQARMASGARTGDLDHRDVRAVLDAALDPLQAGALIENAGWVAAAGLALDVLTLALADDVDDPPGKPAAPVKRRNSPWARFWKRASQWALRLTSCGR
jgi:hypothetical protein